MAAELRLYPFASGTIEIGSEWIRNNVFGDRIHVPATWFLITHPRGNIIVDGGCPAQAGIDDTAHWGPAITEVFGMRCVMEPEQACLPTLGRVGFDPADIAYIAQTHLHSDHLGAISEIGSFPNAKVLTSRAEWEYSRAPDDFVAAAYVKKDLDQPGIPWELIEDHEDGYDLFGDGTISAFHTPGHAWGHLSYLVRLPNTGAVLLTGDACDTEDHWNELALPGFALSNQKAIRSARRLRRLAKREEATVIFSHDPDQWPRIRSDGSFYD
jgi:glyoxylase-like metal-dependent hydrolase (beta-lactamase superfamily II)